MSLLFGRRGEQRSMEYSESLLTGEKSVSQSRALHLGPLFSAYRHIVDYGSTLPVDCFGKDGDKRVSRPLPQFLSRLDQRGEIGLSSFLSQALFGLATGNAVGWGDDYDAYGNPGSVRWLSHTQWSFDETNNQWRINGEPVPASRITHIPWIVPPGKVLGLSPIEHYAAAINAGLSAQEYADVKRGGGLPPVVVKNTAKTIEPKAAEIVKQRAKASFAKGEPWVTGSDWDLTAVTIPPNQAQFVETMKLSASQIAAAFGIDPTEIGGQAANSLTYSTEELRQINRAANMRPYIVRLERAFSRLAPARQFVQFNVDATMRVDIKTRTQVVGDQIKDGRMSVNEARGLEDRSPVAGGDFHNVPAPKAEPNTRTQGEQND